MDDKEKNIRQAFAEARRQQDFDDLQNEMAGRETGRARRFLTANQFEARQDGRYGKLRQDTLSRVQLLLASDAAYAALYQDTLDVLDAAERKTEGALAAMADALTKARQRHDAFQERAARLPDGTIVFRDAAGQIRTEDGTILSAAEADAVQWRGDKPSFDDYTSSRRAIEKAEAAVGDVEAYQVNVLGRIRDRMSDEDNPPTTDELKEFTQDINDHMPSSLQAAEGLAVSPDVTPPSSVSAVAVRSLP